MESRVTPHRNIFRDGALHLFRVRLCPGPMVLVDSGMEACMPAATLVTDTMIPPQARHLQSEFVQEWVKPQYVCTVAFASVVGEDGATGMLYLLRSTNR
jgi:hypothetical protein